jgi:hypothetical protein
MYGAKLGNAKNWGANAKSRGYLVDTNPTVGSVAYTTAGEYGHVAWVAEVNGDNIVIEEYNYNSSRAYHTRTVAKSKFTGYIHFKDVEVAPPAPIPAPSKPIPTISKDVWGIDECVHIFWEKCANASWYDIWVTRNGEIVYTRGGTNTDGDTTFIAEYFGKEFGPGDYSFRMSSINYNNDGVLQAGESEGIYFKIAPDVPKIVSADIPDGWYSIQHKSSGNFISTSAYTDNGLGSFTYPPGAGNGVLADDQIFKFERQSDDSYVITSKHSNKVLEVRSGSMQAGAPIQQWEWADNYNQRWYIVEYGSGTYRIISTYSGMCIDVPNDSPKSVGIVQDVLSGDDNKAQQFSLVPYSPEETTTTTSTTPTTTSTSQTTTTTTPPPTAPEMYGDLNGDSKVELTDIVTLCKAISSEDMSAVLEPQEIANADVYADGKVDSTDLSVFANAMVNSKLSDLPKIPE